MLSLAPQFVNVLNKISIQIFTETMTIVRALVIYLNVCLAIGTVTHLIDF